MAADRYFARFVGEESYSKGQSKKYLIPDVGPSWCIDPCKLRTDRKETYGSLITLNDMAILAYLKMCFSSGWYVSRSSNLAMRKLSGIGTVNFIHLAPFYCVSIAFLWNGEPIIGAVNAPFLRQL